MKIWFIRRKIWHLIVVAPLSFAILKSVSWLFNKENSIYTIISIVIFLLILSIWILIRRTKKDTSQSYPMQMQDQIFADAPITTEKEDILNRKNFVENLKDIISAHPLDEQSVRICIDAKWGEGKTSVFNLLKERLKEEKNTICIDFNPWYYNNEESALKGLIKLLGNAVSNQPPYPRANDDIDELIKAIAGGACNKFLGIPFGTLFKEDKDIQKSVTSISESVKKTKKKYVIFIDDLDRLDAPAIKPILKMIMVMSEIKSLIFVIAASTEHICADDKISKEYVEKIMTVILPLPIFNRIEIREYFCKKFDEIIKGENFPQEENKIIKDRIQRTFLSLKKLCTLRNIKRVLETFKLLHKPLAGEVDVVDFIFIVYLYIYFPKIVEEIYKNRYEFVKDFSLPARDKTDKTAEGRFFQKRMINKENNRNTYFEELIGSYPRQDDKEDLQVILYAMFQKFKLSKSYLEVEYCEHPKSIYDGKYFSKYFRFCIDKTDISDKLIEKYICKWKESKNPESYIRKIFIKCRQNDDNINIFFKKLDDKRDMAGPELLKKITKVYSLITNYDKSFVEFIINNFSGDKVFLEDILQNMKSLVCCSTLVEHLKNDYNDYYEKVFLKRLKELTPEQILKCENYDTNLTREIHFMIFSSEDVFRKEYAPIIAADKRLILNYMQQQSWTFSFLNKLWGEDNYKKAISFLEKQNLTEEEEQIFSDFKKTNEKDADT